MARCKQIRITVHYDDEFEIPSNEYLCAAVQSAVVENELLASDKANVIVDDWDVEVLDNF